MKHRTRIAAALALAAAAGAASAQDRCPNASTRIVEPAEITALVAGRTMCASRGSDSWQEHHQAGGALIDYKRGPNDPVDPSTRVGTWSVVAGPAGGGWLRHDYGGGQQYEFIVCRRQAGDRYALISRNGGGDLTGVEIVAGNNGCAGTGRRR